MEKERQDEKQTQLNELKNNYKDSQSCGRASKIIFTILAVITVLYGLVCLFAFKNFKAPIVHGALLGFLIVCCVYFLVSLMAFKKEIKDSKNKGMAIDPEFENMIKNEKVLVGVEEEDKQHLLVVKNLKKYFPVATNFFGKPTKWLHAVENVSFVLDEGKTLGIVGESGCGKTTLGRTILKLYDIQGGQVVYNGNNITNLTSPEMIPFRTQIQYVFQDPYSSLPPRLPIGEIIAQPVRIHHIVPKDQVRDYVLQVMKDCGLQPHFYDRYPHEFSGGQRQRICIARALAVKPKLVILDEPVSALDVSIQAQIINLLRKLQEKDGFTYLFITHDISVVKYVSDEIGVMYLGSMVEKGSTESIFAEPLHPYTNALFSAVPVADPNVKMNRIILKGDIPSPSNPPKGCKFHTRCSKCMKICEEVEPEFKEIRPKHFVACHLYDDEKQEKENG